MASGSSLDRGFALLHGEGLNIQSFVGMVDGSSNRPTYLNVIAAWPRDNRVSSWLTCSRLHQRKDLMCIHKREK
jgi:hypothetical protein